MSLLRSLDEYDVRASLTYHDHPLSAAYDDFIDLEAGTLTRVKVSIEEVRTTCPSLTSIN